MRTKVAAPEGFHFEESPTNRTGKFRRGPQHGYIDKDGNEWVKGPNHNFHTEIDPATGLPYTYEWDVQLADGRRYCNVRPQDGPVA